MLTEDDEWLNEQKRARSDAMDVLRSLLPGSTPRRVVIRRKRGQALVSIGSTSFVATTVRGALEAAIEWWATKR